MIEIKKDFFVFLGFVINKNRGLVLDLVKNFLLMVIIRDIIFVNIVIWVIIFDFD